MNLNEGTILLQFGASWCKPCAAIQPQAEQIAQMNAARYVKIDVEQEHKLATQFNVRGVPTFVVLRDGQELGRQQAGTPNALRQLVHTCLSR